MSTPDPPLDPALENRAKELLHELKPIQEDVQPPTGMWHANIIRADAIEPKSVEWIWDGWLARGKLHILGGQPGTGKTTIALAVAATITNSGKFPDGSQAPSGSVLIWSGEDDVADSIVPRFMANGGERARLRCVQGTVDDTGGLLPFDPSTDMELLIDSAQRISDLALLIIDPVVAAVSGDSHKNAEVRRGLQPLVEFAERTGAAILGISHYSKGTSGRDPVDRVTGSLAFTAAPRMVWGTAKPLEDGKSRRFVRIKSNIGPDGGGFEYDLKQLAIEPCSKISNQAVLWGETLIGNARELMAEIEVPDGDNDAPEREDCKRWLLNLLGEDPFDAGEIERLSKVTGRSMRTLKRVKADLGIISRKVGNRWVWELPKSANLVVQECHTKMVAPLTSFGTLGGSMETEL